MDKKQFIKGFVKTDKASDGFSVIASTASIDRQGESIDQNGWDLTNYKNNPIILWAHDYSALPIGVAENVEVKDGQLVMDGRFASAEANPMAEQVRKLYAEGVLKTVSVGFIPHERNGNVITKAELLEVSFVPVPANAEALSLAMTKGLKVEQALVELVEKCADHDITEPEAKHDDEPVEPITDTTTKADPAVQSVELSKDIFASLEEATAWIVDNGFVADNVTETEANYIFAQFDVTLCEDGTATSVGTADGITQNVCMLSDVTENDGKAVTVDTEVKSGRVLSAKTRGLITSTVENMKTSIVELEKLLMATETPEKDNDVDTILQKVDQVKKVEGKCGIVEISEETLKELLSHTRQAEQKTELANAVLKRLLKKN